MHIITWVCPPCSSVSQIIISHAQFQKHFSVQEFQLKSVSFLRYPLKSSFLPLVFCCYFQAYGIFSFRQLAWHLVQRSVIYAVFYRVLLSKDDFPGESISFIFPQLKKVESTVPRDISLGPHRQLVLTCCCPPTQKMRAYFSAKTQSTTQGDLLGKRMTYDFSLLDFFLSPKG